MCGCGGLGGIVGLCPQARSRESEGGPEQTWLCHQKPSSRAEYRLAVRSGSAALL